MNDQLRVRLKSLDVSDPTKAKVIFSLSAVSEDTVERELVELPVDETTGLDRNINANLIITEAKIALGIRLKGALEYLKAELPRDVSTHI